MAKKEKEPKEEKKPGFWASRTTKEKIYMIVCLIVLLGFIFVIITFIFPRTFYGDAVADLYIEGKPNALEALGDVLKNVAFKIVGSIFTLGLVFILTFIINFIINLVTYNKANKTRTVSSLVRSCIRYIAVIIAIAVILTIWGVDVGSIVASLGVLTLIIGLGCQSLIQDVVSGLFIVFDNFYSVGDMVIIDGFRGTVVEIGLRSTKLKDFANNIKSINNSNVGTVINLSAAGDSAPVIKIQIGFNEDLRRVEAIIHENLPKIKERIPKIVGNIQYLGVDAIGESGVTLAFLAYVNEDDRIATGRDLNREIYLMLVDNNVTIPFHQVVVNQPDSRSKPKATDEQIASVEKELTKTRAVPKEAPKKKRNIKHVFSDALTETADMYGDKK